MRSLPTVCSGLGVVDVVDVMVEVEVVDVEVVDVEVVGCRGMWLLCDVVVV